MTKPFHAGRASESGIVAADLALEGFSAAPNILEADRGFFSAAGGGFDARMIEGQLGDPWTFQDPGVSIKPHPSGSLSHPGMGAMLDLVQRESIRPEMVASVHVGTNRHIPNALIHERPTTELEAKFSMQYCLAICILERRAGLAEFTDEVIGRPDVQDMVRRIELAIDPEAEAAGYDKMTTLITMRLTDGRTLHARGDFAKGSPSNPMSDAEMASKFAECLAWGGLSEDVASRVLLLLDDLANLPSLNELSRLLTGQD
jgi:2-methylcitrate dehydratase PrpD